MKSESIGMGSRALTLVVAFLLVGVLSSPNASARGDSIPFCMAIYNWVYNFTEISEMGFDAFYQQADWTWEKMVPGWHEDRFGTGSLIASSKNITYVAGQYYQQPSWDYIDFNYSRAVDQFGSVESRTPSPIDEAWWEYMIEEPALFIANLSLHYPIWGIVWDMELYYDDDFDPPDYSFDEAALQAFGEETNRTIPSLSPKQRRSWLVSLGLLDDYLEWQENKAYALARAVGEQVHSINPNLSLGLLCFEDAWFHWKILEGFNCSTAPVTGWNEQTYGGYKLGGSEGVDTYQRLWAEHGLNGKFLPGIAGPPTWFDRLTAIEAAIRHNGAVWSYPGVYGHHQADDFRKTHIFIRSHLFFNSTRASPLPEFDLHPGVNARPYLGPNGTVSLYLNPYGSGSRPPMNFTVLTDSPELVWAGYNLTTKTLRMPNPTLTPSDFPCIIAGLRSEDLLPTEVWALIRELSVLLQVYRSAGLVPPSDAQQALASAEQEYREGMYEEARSRLLGGRGQTYAYSLDALWPRIQEGLANPRESPIPLSALRNIVKAKTFFETGDDRRAEMLMLQGLMAMSASVAEGRYLIPLLLLVFAHICRQASFPDRRIHMVHHPKPRTKTRSPWKGPSPSKS